VLRLPAPVVLLLAVLALGACGSDDDSKEASTPSDQVDTTATTPSTTSGGCKTVEQPAPKSGATVPKPTKELDASKTYTVDFVTSCGPFTVTLDVKNDPKTSASFANLVEKGFYDGLTFHRISPGFVIQGGDPEGTGQGGPGYSVEEAPPEGTTYPRGTVAMAKTGTEPPGTSGSQFFVVTAEDASQPPFSLPPDYAVAGKVTTGIETVNRIGALPPKAAGSEEPAQPVVIESAKLTEK
jgi:peptidyl-prolyl cis-trans isomerase B (cyclophilin B)